MSLSSTTSAQVQAILEAAENSAEHIKRDAEAEAEGIRSAAHESRQQDLSAVNAVVAALREDAERLRAGIAALEAQLAGLQGGTEASVPEPVVTQAPDTPAPSAARDGEDAEGARLIALNMALNGQPREEADRYLSENFDLADRSALLDDVYSTVEG